MSAKKLVITLASGEELTVQPTLQDTLAFESTLRKNKQWGGLQDSALKMHPFKAWSAAKRAELLDLTWEEFTTGDTAALDVTFEDEDDDEGDDGLGVTGLGKGTRKAASTSSSSSSPSVPTPSPTSGPAKKLTT